jgi:hypothetical protein
MRTHEDDSVREVADFWTKRLDRTMQGYRTMIYELGKVNDVVRICHILIEARGLIENNGITMSELKKLIIAVRTDTSAGL